MWNREIELKRVDGVRFIAQLSVESGESCRISMAQPNAENEVFIGFDFWEAFTNLRKWAEGQGIRVLCQGAKANLVCSGMSRSMGGGRKGYVVRLGQHADSSCLVDILDAADEEEVSTVDKQQEFQRQWLESVRK
jgi:hypothetical protein